MILQRLLLRWLLFGWLLLKWLLFRWLLPGWLLLRWLLLGWLLFRWLFVRWLLLELLLLRRLLLGWLLVRQLLLTLVIFADFEQVKNLIVIFLTLNKLKKLTIKLPWEKLDAYASFLCQGLMSLTLHPCFSDLLGSPPALSSTLTLGFLNA